jgi:hypothetical protein
MNPADRESIPVEKRPGDEVVGASINKQGSFLSVHPGLEMKWLSPTS